MSMKLLTLVGAATTAASSASSNTAAAPSISSSRIGPAATAASASAISPPRTLQDADGTSYSYLDDLTGYSLQYSNCVRVKIPQENDDDEVDGNVNFYNGRYHAQYSIFATYHVCGGDGSNNGGDQCSAEDCDYGTEYAMEVGEYLGTQLDHWEGYCEGCMEQCTDNNRDRGRRRLEDDAENGAQVDCDACATPCTNYYQGGQDDGDGNDESAYVDCQDGGADEDGLQVYYGPQCDGGRLVVGVFYDDECTIKTKHDGPELDYYKFSTIMSGCVDCSDETGQETCGDLYDESFHCVNGKDQTGQDNNMKACSTIKKALTSVDYTGVKKRHSGADFFLKVFFTLAAVGLVGGFLFLTYTYYVRHRGEKSQPMLSSEDVHEEMAEAPPGGTLT
eukprot:CAMPEP_0181124926 /NCGR_PEP_ID=MMETSP1071-20121207/26765_1 /TAXON_ID=35127 /ORGANISM="Thalassiosira sp., Strain NH16" /LENGTH=390 /DNA_ID=CAMNT_0023210311 /DNA_START=58 /DNA_END=1230 /DNA_ORIENTATION=-